MDGSAKPEELTEGLFSGLLDTAGIPDPELIIRPSGEIRTSNFLLWQSAYAEYYFTDVLWPDFDEAELKTSDFVLSEQEPPVWRCQMKQRLLVAAVGVPALLVILLALPPVATTILVCLIAGIAAYELIHTAAKAPRPITYILTIACALVCVVNIELPEIIWPAAAFLLLTALCLIAVLTHGKRKRHAVFGCRALHARGRDVPRHVQLYRVSASDRKGSGAHAVCRCVRGGLCVHARRHGVRRQKALALRFAQ